ncbi:MAG: hypothetical protein WDM86_22875 [Rhizomicrobium sp.]
MSSRFSPGARIWAAVRRVQRGARRGRMCLGDRVERRIGDGAFAGRHRDGGRQSGRRRLFRRRGNRPDRAGDCDSENDNAIDFSGHKRPLLVVASRTQTQCTPNGIFRTRAGWKESAALLELVREG